jgi:NitT/TauT family transport system ATP-binding protein
MLTLDGVGRRFPNGTQALLDVSLRIEAGEAVALLGPSGCGKSTLLRLIAGLDHPDAGALRWDGGPPGPGEIGYVFQDATLLPWATAAQNVALPLRLRQRRDPAAVQDALNRVGLAGFAESRPSQLSGGMRMRVSLARALVTRPRLLLLDEPFAALDEFTRHRLQDDLRALRAEQGITTVLVTHSTYEAAWLARRTVILSPRPGRIAREIVSTLPPGIGRGDPAYAALVAALGAAAQPMEIA